MLKRRYSPRLGLFAIMMCLSTTVQAQSVVVDRHLSFGHVSIRDNSVQRDIQLLPTGNYIADPEYIFYADEPELGQLSISGQPAVTLMNVSFDILLTVVGPSGGGGGTGTFTLVNPFTAPAVVITSPAGAATFEIGATLRSDGSGMPFLDNLYRGVFQISVSY